MMISLDGFFEGKDHDLTWHHVDDEFNKFAAKQMEETGSIFFGRRTYELMESFWPNYQPVDKENVIVRRQMDTLPKFVFSRTLQKVSLTDDWQKVTLVHELNKEQIAKLKQQQGKDIAILGSSDLCVGLLRLNVIDEIRLMVNPVVINAGKRLFEGLEERYAFKLSDTRTFGSGNVLLTYSVETT